jgi:hypothetical protein
MNEDELHTFCGDVLNGQTVDEFTVYWDYPGFINLSHTDEPITNERDEGACLIATPDFVNGDPNRITFSIDFAGLQLALSDEEGVTWTKETALETWRAAVEKRLNLARYVFTVLRREGEDGLRRLIDEHGGLLEKWP